MGRRADVGTRAKAGRKRTEHARRALLVGLKDTPCADCEHEYPSYVMDFDHVRGVKCFNLSRANSRGLSIERILREAAKCDVVCANCYRDRTHQRRLD